MRLQSRPTSCPLTLPLKLPEPANPEEASQWSLRRSRSWRISPCTPPEISRIIEEIEITTDEATQVARQAKGIVADQNQSVGSTTDSFREIDSKVTELLKFLQQINAGVTEMEHQRSTTLSAISGISAVSAETAAGSSNVQTAAEKQLQAIQDLDKATSALAARSEELTTILEGFIV